MVERFNALVERGCVDLEAWFNERIGKGRSWIVDESTWRFRYRYLPETKLFGRTQHWPLQLFVRRPDVLVSLYAEPVFVCGWGIAKLRRIKTCFRVLATYDRWVSRHPVKEGMKRFLFRRVDAIETPGADGRSFAEYYGAPAEKIFLATHTVDIPYFRNALLKSRLERERRREQLGLVGVTFMYVGRLWWAKGLFYLLDAFEKVQNSVEDPVSLLLLGDGPEEGALRLECKQRQLKNVVFAGFKQKTELPRYYALADAFVFPTLGDPYGLVVDEAMICSLPVISTSSAGEIRARIEHGVNGYIVPPEDSAALAKRMVELTLDGELRERMGKASSVKISDHTPERWAAEFESMVLALVQ